MVTQAAGLSRQMPTGTSTRTTTGVSPGTATCAHKQKRAFWASMRMHQVEQQHSRDGCCPLLAWQAEAGGSAAGRSRHLPTPTGSRP